MIAMNAHPFIELTRTLATLKNTGKCGKLLGKLLSILAKEKTPKWVIDNWNQSGLKWSDLINSECEKVDLLEKYNLEFVVKGINNNCGKLSENKMTLEQISEYLLKLLKEENFDNITSWISLNVGQQSKQPQFVRCLVTDILKTSIEAIDESWRLKSETFCKLLPLITRYVDAKRDLELQCLYAIQSYNHELMYPQGILSKIIDHLCDQYVLSDDAFIEWGKTENPNERNGHAVAIKTLTSFFTKLREAERDDSSE
ncbi:eukaryotic translation initiation factor 4 gamma 3-like [Chelonus insularis]|uniref:eukaryotic translation initiation factor 4 gamma 3-like n=1 Tax=Chelonus insularis TaxID=460826 RepID=UPI00158F2446|nr:eukaryotic translation initiation factor 4 gamma 3-like [Chelonus insularis]